MEIVFKNGIRVFRNASIVKQIFHLVTKYLSIWESQNFVWILPKRWMKVSLKRGWETKVSVIMPRVYPLGNNA